jgi:hypothetical protein
MRPGFRPAQTTLGLMGAKAWPPTRSVISRLLASDAGFLIADALSNPASPAYTLPL